MAINVNRQRVEAYLQKKLQQLEMISGDWADFEGIGRCLLYLDDLQATEYFQQAAMHYPLFPGSTDSHLQQANLYRLAGDRDCVRQHYQQAQEVLLPFDFTDPEHDSELDQLALCAYMLGDDALTIEAVAHLRPLYRKDEWLLCFALAALAEARQQRHGARASATVATIEEVIRNDCAQPWETGTITLWDVYAEARRVVRDLGGDSDAAGDTRAGPQPGRAVAAGGFPIAAAARWQVWLHEADAARFQIRGGDGSLSGDARCIAEPHHIPAGGWRSLEQRSWRLHHRRLPRPTRTGSVLSLVCANARCGSDGDTAAAGRRYLAPRPVGRDR
ncbi:MAG: hypothetical protein MI924_14370 [Chloroflexales bacterium]|nr:hypothetical protein [Chloroflexales bacterium]